MPQRELVSLKGTGDGVIIRIYSGGDTGDISHCIADKIRQNRNFFRGCCNIYIESEAELSRSDEIRLKSIIDTFLPECSVTYRSPGKNDRRVQGRVAQTESYTILSSKGAVETASVYEGDIGAYQHFRVVGNALIIGNVCEKAKVTAGGNVIVLGDIYGDVRAGYPDNDKAYIVFKNADTGELSIGRNAYKSDTYNMQKHEECEENTLKKAQSINNSIFIINFL